mmetsp:Transcript_57032/g.165265  ORF Transcript_57032/g.165265 Transcript_57032/m.165265 type:complete len:101 (+) Transcript_57032:398-700(+)
MNVNEGVLNRRSNTGTSGHVANPFGSFLVKDGIHEISIANITTINLYPLIAIFLSKHSEIGFLDSHVVIVIHFIDNDYIIPSLEKVVGDVATDKTCTSSY